MRGRRRESGILAVVAPGSAEDATAPVSLAGAAPSVTPAAAAPDVSAAVARAALQAACDFRDLAIAVEVWDADPAAALARLREDERLRGAVLLPPADEAAIPRLDLLDDWAADVGAADLVLVEARRGRRRLAGYGCAVDGILAAFREAASCEPGGKRAVLLGAGASARSVAFALAAAEAESLAVWDPTPGRAAALVAALRAFAPDVRLMASADDSALDAALAEYDLLVAGLTPRPPFPAGEGGIALPDRGLVLDLALASDTPLLAAARDEGCGTLDGLTLLVHRLGAAFERLADKRAPLGLMLARAREAAGS